MSRNISRSILVFIIAMLSGCFYPTPWFFREPIQTEVPEKIITPPVSLPFPSIAMSEFSGTTIFVCVAMQTSSFPDVYPLYFFKINTAPGAETVEVKSNSTTLPMECVAVACSGDDQAWAVLHSPTENYLYDYKKNDTRFTNFLTLNPDTGSYISYVPFDLAINNEGNPFIYCYSTDSTVITYPFTFFIFNTVASNFTLRQPVGFPKVSNSTTDFDAHYNPDGTSYIYFRQDENNQQRLIKVLTDQTVEPYMAADGNNPLKSQIFMPPRGKPEILYLGFDTVKNQNGLIYYDPQSGSKSFLAGANPDRALYAFTTGNGVNNVVFNPDGENSNVYSLTHFGQKFESLLNKEYLSLNVSNITSVSFAYCSDSKRPSLFCAYWDASNNVIHYKSFDYF